MTRTLFRPLTLLWLALSIGSAWADQLTGQVVGIADGDTLAHRMEKAKYLEQFEPANRRSQAAPPTEQRCVNEQGFSLHAEVRLGRPSAQETRKSGPGMGPGLKRPSLE